MRFIRWLCQVWSVCLIIAVLLTTFFTYQCYSVKAYKTISLVTQIVGIFFILYSINENYKIIFERNLKTFFMDWIKAFPSKRVDVIVHATGVSMDTKIGNPEIVTINPNNIKEEIVYIHKKIDGLNHKVESNFKPLKNDLSNLGSQVGVQDKGLFELSDKIKKIYSGLNSSIIGVFLMLYSAVIGAIPDIFW